jgi:hypothetical protein
VQLVIAVIILGLSAYGVAGAAFDGDIFIMVVVSQTLQSVYDAHLLIMTS